MNEHNLPTADDERYRAFALIRRLLTEQGLVHWRKYAVAFRAYGGGGWLHRL